MEKQTILIRRWRHALRVWRCKLQCTLGRAPTHHQKLNPSGRAKSEASTDLVGGELGAIHRGRSNSTTLGAQACTIKAVRVTDQIGIPSRPKIGSKRRNSPHPRKSGERAHVSKRRRAAEPAGASDFRRGKQEKGEYGGF
jgi:hypothetical protein